VISYPSGANGKMKPAISDEPGRRRLAVDWMRMSATRIRRLHVAGV
jgi:hypothetical protein